MGNSAMKSVLRKIRILLYKNFLLRRRRIVITVCEVLLPILAVLFYLLIKWQNELTLKTRLDIKEDSVTSTEKTFDSFSMKTFCQIISNSEDLISTTDDYGNGSSTDRSSRDRNSRDRSSRDRSSRDRSSRDRSSRDRNSRDRSSRDEYETRYSEDEWPEKNNPICSIKQLLMYSPSDSDTVRMFLENLVNETNGRITLEGFLTEDDILDTITANTLRDYEIENKPKPPSYEKKITDKSDFLEDNFIAIIFKDGLPPSGPISYKIRMSSRSSSSRLLQTGKLFPSSQKAGPENHLSYMNSGFINLQVYIDQQLIQFLTGSASGVNFNIQAFPYPQYDELNTADFDYSNKVQPLSMAFMAGFLFIVPAIILNVVSEKQTGVKELMKMMGLPNWIHWFTWMISSLAFSLLTMTLIIILLSIPIGYGAVISDSDPTLWWFSLALYLMAATAFCFFISSIFQSPVIAMISALVLWIFTYFLTLIMLSPGRYRATSFTNVLAFALMPNAGLFLIFRTMFMLRAKGEAYWENIGDSMSSGDPLTLLHVWLMLIIDIIMYWSLAVYLDNVLPSKYGIRKPVYYLFLPSTWVSRQKPTIEDSSDTRNTTEKTDAFEAEDPTLTPGIIIQNLSKKFGRKKVAVDNVSLTIYSGQITCLLGHNGAGKTSTMSMLTGMFAPTSGTALVNGYNIKNQIDEVRNSLGLCPQDNLLFTKLTVKEHLLFFARLKGLTSKQAKADVEKILGELRLLEKAKSDASNLSGGQKRKLCLGIALVGGTKVVILDEPTSGLDPEARRAIWDVLGGIRGQRTILLTTHYMEEADVLGDRIAIMASGQIKCCGTPNFLKRYYGAGYTLRMTIKPEANKEKIFKLVQNSIPSAAWKSEKVSNKFQIAITLPSDADATKAFPELFSSLEGNRETLGIITVGLSLTTMDDVFFKVGELDEESQRVAAKDNASPEPKVSAKPSIEAQPNNIETEDANADVSSPTLSEQNIENPVEGESNTPKTNDEPGKGNEENQTGIQAEQIPTSNNTPAPNRNANAGPSPRVYQQFWGLLMKRCHYSKRKYSLFISEFIVPVLLIWALVALLNYMHARVKPEHKPLTMKLEDYQGAVTLYSADDQTEEYGEAYESITSARKVDEDLIEELIDIGTKNLQNYRQNYIVAANFFYANTSQATALYSTVATHSNPLSVNLISNAILKDRNSESTIEIINHPFDSIRDELTKVEDISRQRDSPMSVEAFFVIPFIGMALSVFAASFIIFPIEETQCKAKQLQFMTGVNPIVYWGASLVWDLFMTFILSLLVLAIIAGSEYWKMYTDHTGAGIIMFMLLFYGFSAAMLAYVMSTQFTTGAGGYAVLVSIQLFGGMFLQIMTIPFMFIYPPIAIGVRIFGQFLPVFGITFAFARFTKLANDNSRCNAISDKIKDQICGFDRAVSGLALVQECCRNCKEKRIPGLNCFEPKSYLEWEYTIRPALGADYSVPGIAQDIFYVFLIGILYLAILLYKEFVVCRKNPSSLPFQQPKDPDVLTEIARVQNMLAAGEAVEDALVVDGLCKRYNDFIAVSNLTFGVHPAECFGLLGVNGAGKTTTFGILTGDIVASDGSAYSGLFSLTKKRNRFLARIGYCPQFNGILGLLTGREMLILFARLRGVKNPTEEAKKWLQKLGLSDSGKVKSENYSGGMKRRLSAGMALIGDPPIILLDEPTSGVDPISRRQFWNIIADVTNAGQAVVLTSHSMDECQALCSRLGIMVNGQFQCFGGVEHLKSKFTLGFTISIKFRPELSIESAELETLHGDILQKFEPCILRDQHLNSLVYHVQNTQIPWSAAFQLLEDFKTNYGDVIEDYSVNETTLEDVFVEFARMQSPERAVKDGKSCFCSYC